MTALLDERLASQAAAHSIGRVAELAVLEQLLQPDGPIVCYVHGIGGIGKSTLVDMFATRARVQGSGVVTLDCRSIEPTEPGFLYTLASAIDARAPTLAAIVEQLASARALVVVALDSYEAFRLLDAWLRGVFIPAMPANVRMLLAGREPPLSAWLTTPGWRGLFRTLTLGPLRETDALALMRQAGIPPAQAARLNRFAGGHPLTLRLAIAASEQRPDLPLDAAALQPVIDQLSRLYLAEVPDLLLRRALQAATITRRLTRGLLRALLPELDSDELYDRLRGLACVEAQRDGLVIHDVVCQVLAADLKAADPAAYRRYRRAVWLYLREEVQQAERAELWRYTADMLYLLEGSAVREVFFPTGSAWFAIEPARHEDGAAIAAIATCHEGPEACRLLAACWRGLPQAFQVVRDGHGATLGFYCLFVATAAPAALLQADPITRAWASHLKRNPVGGQERVLFMRGWLSRDHGELPSAEQAAIFLDIKRAYMELRPQLRRIYVPVRDLETYGAFLQQVGFRALPEASVTIDGVVYHTLMLDFGPASVDGWLADLVGSQITARVPEAMYLDAAARELVVDGERIALSHLEFQVLRYLDERAGQAVPRGDLLEDVWGYSYEGASNVVDVVVRALRKKLGPYAGAIETVTKVGYRFRRP
jgi:hypothetical protein